METSTIRSWPSQSRNTSNLSFRPDLNIYNKTRGLYFLFSRLEIWPGYVIAVDDYEGGLHLQCDVSHRVLRSETVLDVLNTLTRDAKQRGTQAEIYSEVEKALLGKYLKTILGTI